MNAHTDMLDFEDRANKTSIRLVVISLHAAIFLFIAFVATPNQIKKSAQKLVVRTVSLDSSKSHKAHLTAPLPEKNSVAEMQTAQIHDEIAIAPAPVDLPTLEELSKPEIVEKTQAEPPPTPKPEMPAQTKPDAKPEPKAQLKPEAKPTAKVQPKPLPQTRPKPQSKPQSQAQVKPKPQPKAQPKPVAKPQTQAKPKTEKSTVDKEAEAKKRAQALSEAKKRAAAEAEAKQNALIAEALQSLNASGSIDQKRGKIASSAAGAVSTPKKITSLASDSLVSVESEGEKFTGKEKTYYDELVHRLKLELRLPDFGDVKIKLTLSRSGKVLKLECLKAKSAKNKAYLEKALPKIVFPAFGQNFLKEESHTFRLHLTNELSY